ncbi:MAG: GHMP kinase [Verrucomicrobia bacterium]|nr:GHMP kinase [Verrucomicrobiota bacterium]
MIISRTPFRVSFAGGGTDLRAFYQHEAGAVISTTIDKYMYLTVNERFDHTVRVSYSKTEIVEIADEVEHPLVREALKKAGITNGIEITSISDIPAGTGFGSSSSFTVGLLNALYAYTGTYAPPERLAQEACEIEIDIVGEPIGKQDQYIAAYGGLQYIRFNPDESVFVDPVVCSAELKHSLGDRLLLFYTGITRSASEILTEQKKQTGNKIEFLRRMAHLAGEIRRVFQEGRDLDEFGELLHEGWMLKRELASGISNETIDAAYDRACAAGALGGKILGAGGGGFLLVYARQDKHPEIKKALAELRQIPVDLEPQGTKIVHVS